MLAALSFPDISPEIFAIDLFGFHFALRWYALAYIIGIAIGWQLLRAALNRPNLWPLGAPPMQVAKLEDLLTYVVVGVIFGGRLGYVLFYQPAHYIANPLEIPQIWTGGMSFHGGFIGVVLAVFVFSHRQKIPLGQLADGIALSATPAIFLVRLANFVNAELWGRQTDVPWGVIFPTQAAQSCATATELCARHPSQLYEAGVEGLLLGLVLWTLATRYRALRTPWKTTGVFFAGYGLARFFVEFLRQPDAQFVTIDNPLGLAYHIGGYGLTMGQTLSVPMIVIGVVLTLRSRRA